MRCVQTQLKLFQMMFPLNIQWTSLKRINEKLHSNNVSLDLIEAFTACHIKLIVSDFKFFYLKSPKIISEKISQI